MHWPINCILLYLWSPWHQPVQICWACHP